MFSHIIFMVSPMPTSALCRWCGLVFITFVCFTVTKVLFGSDKQTQTQTLSIDTVTWNNVTNHCHCLIAICNEKGKSLGTEAHDLSRPWLGSLWNDQWAIGSDGQRGRAAASEETNGGVQVVLLPSRWIASHRCRFQAGRRGRAPRVPAETTSKARICRSAMVVARRPGWITTKDMLLHCGTVLNETQPQIGALWGFGGGA